MKYQNLTQFEKILFNAIDNTITRMDKQSIQRVLEVLNNKYGKNK